MRRLLGFAIALTFGAACVEAMRIGQWASFTAEVRPIASQPQEACMGQLRRPDGSGYALDVAEEMCRGVEQLPWYHVRVQNLWNGEGVARCEATALDGHGNEVDVGTLILDPTDVIGSYKHIGPRGSIQADWFHQSIPFVPIAYETRCWTETEEPI